MAGNEVGREGIKLITDQELRDIFKGAERSVDVLRDVFKEHKNIKTVILNPDSWVGKELMWQSRRLIDLRNDIYKLELSINRLEEKIDKLFDDTK